MPATTLRLKKCPKCGSVQLIDCAFCGWCAHRFSTSFGPPLVYARPAPCFSQAYESRPAEVGGAAADRQLLLDLIPIPRSDEWLRLGVVVMAIILAMLLITVAIRSVAASSSPAVNRSVVVPANVPDSAATTPQVDVKSAVPGPFRTYDRRLDSAVKTSEHESSNL